MLRSDFFQPLCDLIDDTVTIDVKDMELTNMSTVLSLSEICLRTIKKMPLGKVNDLIIHVLCVNVITSMREGQLLAGTVCVVDI